MKFKLKHILKWSAGALLLVLFGWIQIAYWSSTNDCAATAAAPAHPIKAIKFCEYGPPDVLKLVGIEKPVPNDNEVLVRVRAASLNFFDGIVRGPPLARFMVGLRKPKITRFGNDFAGVVEAVGSGVTEFKPGDEVFGVKRGSVAQYVCARQTAVVAKPANVTFEQAAAVPWAGLTALQGLRAGKIRAGQKVLINGASGGVGTFALQIAKALDTEVTAVCSTRNVEIARSLGADHVIDYTKEDFTKTDQRYDLFYDNVSNRAFSERRRLLSPQGLCVQAGLGGVGDKGQLTRLARTLFGPIFSRQFVRYGTHTDKADLTFLRDLMAEGKMKPVVDKTYPMTETAEALRYMVEGHARGKIVIVIGEDS